MSESESKRPRGKGAETKDVSERRRSGQARAIADLMPDIGRAAFRRFGFVQSSVVTRWAEIVGERYARVSSPEAIRFPAGKRAEGTLHLMVESSHAPMMQHVMPDIIERVNRFFGYQAVARVSMRQGRVERREPAEAGPPPRMLRPVPAELGDSLREIADPELRNVLEALAQGLANPPSLPKIS
ncbi:MAG: DUF721 domain-containing protein [Sphingobium sp.]|nr:DUF721 domain-containing protein [Sphingobium sp.]